MKKFADNPHDYEDVYAYVSELEVENKKLREAMMMALETCAETHDTNELRSIAMADILEEALDKRANIDNLGKN